MRLTYISFILFISQLSVTLAVPVDYRSLEAGNDFQIPGIEQAPVLENTESKRESPALTKFFKTLNNSATINLAKAALKLSVTRNEAAKFVGTFIETKGLTSILSAADQSGMALDLVLMVLTHYETVDGALNVINYHRNLAPECVNQESPGLLGGLFNGATSKVGGLLGIGSSFPSSSFNSLESCVVSTSGSIASSTTASGGSISDSTIGSDRILEKMLQFDPNETASSASETNSAGISVIAPVTKYGSVAPIATVASIDLPVISLTSVPGVPLTFATSTTSVIPTEEIEVGSAGPYSGVVSEIDNTSNDFFEHETEVTESGNLLDVMRREDVDEVESMHQLLKHALADIENENVPHLAKRDVPNPLYAHITRIIGTEGTFEVIFESLSKSGLVRNVAYNALMDRGFYEFDVELVSYLFKNGHLSGSLMLSSAVSSGLLMNIVKQIVTTPAYLKLVMDFVIATFLGRVNSIYFIKALLTII